jgi:hypothetical protein
MTPLQQRYIDILMERVSGDAHPSHQLLDRIEAALWTPEQIAAYVEMLIEKCDESWYPSHQMLARIERVLQLVAVTA